MIKLIGSFGLVIGVLLIVAIAVLFPILFIWALNTLFPVLAIPYSLETWSAVVLMQIFFKTSIEYKKDK
jgi:hypothetical protein